MVDASLYLYRNDLDVYTDEVSEKHIRNMAELKYIQQLIRDNKITKEMLGANVFNVYYPSYVLQHHYNVFVPLLKKVSKEEGKEFLKMAQKNEVTGAFFHETVRSDLKDKGKEMPVLENGVIKMSEEIYFYSGVTSPYITHAMFVCKASEGLALVLVRIRDEKG